MIEEIKKFIKDAGKYSLEKRVREQHKVGFKWGNEDVSSLVTEVDVEISRKFKNFVAENFSNLNYMIIDEESVGQLAGDVFEMVQNTEYQFVIDPIDGTINYAADVPLYGIIIAVMKYGVPLYGFIYDPYFDELVYTDADRVYLEKGGRKEEIRPHMKTSSKIVQGHAWAIDLKPNHFHGRYVMQDYFSAAIYFAYVALGRVKGVFVRAYLWDIAAGMAICKKLGMGFWDYENGNEMTEFSSKNFDKSCRCLKNNIVCFREDYDAIKGISAGLRD